MMRSHLQGIEGGLGNSPEEMIAKINEGQICANSTYTLEFNLINNTQTRISGILRLSFHQKQATFA